MLTMNILIDASGMFYRSLYTTNYKIPKGKKLLETNESKGMFMRKLAMDFSSMLRDFETPKRIILCIDSTSWRKEIEIVDNIGYKGGRQEKKEKNPVDWQAFYDLTAEFLGILGTKGYILSKRARAEADDLLYLWSRKLNKDGENVFIITGDKDILQTACLNANGTWTILLDPVNKRKKISLTQETYDKKDESPELAVSIFNPSSWNSDTDVLVKLLDSFEVNIIDPNIVANTKVIIGDGGDDVPSVITWPDKKEPEKIRNMTENNLQKIVLQVPDILNVHWRDLLNDKYVEAISAIVADLKGIDVDRELVKFNIKRNATLVVLSEDIIPKEIQDSFNEESDVSESIAITSRDEILRGTPWWKDRNADYIPKSFDVFGDMF